MKRNYSLNDTELDALLISLVARRSNIQSLLTTEGMSDKYYAGYRQKLETVDSLLEKFFPGSVAHLLNLFK